MVTLIKETCGGKAIPPMKRMSGVFNQAGIGRMRDSVWQGNSFVGKLFFSCVGICRKCRGVRRKARFAEKLVSQGKSFRS